MDVSILTQQSIVPDQLTNASTASPAATNDIGTTMNRSARPSAGALSIVSSKSAIVQTVVSQQIEIALDIRSPVRDEYHHHEKHVHADQADSLTSKVRQKFHDERRGNAETISLKESHAAAIKSIQVKVQQGFAQAISELNDLGMLDTSASNTIEQVRSEINQLIDQESATPVSDTSLVNAASATRELSTALQVTTRDGDIVNIDISRSQAIMSGGVEIIGSSLAYAGASSSSQLDISVQGELSEKESKSIRKVIERVNDLANKLFSGDTAAAMEKLREFKINSKQLAGMSLNISSSISYAAVSSYTQVSRIPADVIADSLATAQNTIVTNYASNAGSDSASSLVDNAASSNVSAVEQASVPARWSQTEPATLPPVQLVQEAKDMVSEIADSESFENPFKEISKLFEKIADMIASENSDITAKHMDFVKDLFNEVVVSIEKDAEAGEESGDVALVA